MDQPEKEAEPYFTQPVTQIVLMLTTLALVGFGGFIAYPRVQAVFVANPWLNGFIVFVFVIGVFACFWQVWQIGRGAAWIKGFVAGGDTGAVPRLLAPLAALLKSRGAGRQISSSSAGSILESVGTRIEEVRDITRYIVNLLIFLGLLGTFYGLATTVPAVVETIKSLAPSEDEGGVEVFGRLLTGLETQLGGMGVAFASSLLGLAGSLVVGLLELFASHGQNRFYRELEEWLSTITRLGFATGDGEAGADQHAIVGMMDHMAEQMEAMNQMVTQSDVSRSMLEERLGTLAGSIHEMAQKIETGSGQVEAQQQIEALQQIADGQSRMVAALEGRGDGEGVDAESRMRLRSIDVQLLRILEEISAGRQESTADLRTDIAALTTAIRNLQRPAGSTARPAAATQRRG